MDFSKRSLCELCAWKFVKPRLVDILQNTSLKPIRGTEVSETKSSATSNITKLQMPFFEYKISAEDLIFSATLECPWCMNICKALWLTESVHDIAEEVRDLEIVVSQDYFGFKDETTILWTDIFVGVALYHPSNTRRVIRKQLYLKLRYEEDIRMSDLQLNGIRSPEAHLQSQVDTTRRWIEDCYSHKVCNQRVDLMGVPTRVLKVFPECDQDVLKVYTPHPSDRSRYTALSYCWGPTENLTTTSKNLATHTNGILIDNLPRTIRDAVRFTRLLGIEYMWVDSLCILQDDKDDKAREIRNMRTIFKQAFLTLVASKAGSANEGFLDSDRLPKPEIFQVLWPKEIQGLTSIYFEVFDYYDARVEPVNKRAWTLEERLLSPRLVLFTKSGLVWQCEQKEVSHIDGLDPSIISDLGRYRITADESLQTNQKSQYSSFKMLANRWLDIVTDYTERLLTKPTDKLIAIAGVAEEFSLHWGIQLGYRVGGTYHAGVWSEFPTRALAWELSVFETPPKPQIFRGPSWSWAAVDGCVIFMPPTSIMANEDDYQYCYEVVDMQTTKEIGIGPYASTVSGHIIINAPIADGLWMPPSPDSQDEQGRLVIVPSIPRADLIFPEIKADHAEAIPTRNMNVKVVMLVKWAILSEEKQSLGLVLVSEESGVYRRVGSVSGLGGYALAEAAKYEDVTVV